MLEAGPSRIGLGTFKFAGANGFASTDLLGLLTLAGYALATLPGETAITSGAAWGGQLSTDGVILSGFELDVVAGQVFVENDATAATANDTQIRVGEPLKVYDTTIANLKRYRFFSPAGQNVDVRLKLVG